MMAKLFFITFSYEIGPADKDQFSEIGTCSNSKGTGLFS